MDENDSVDDSLRELYKDDRLRALEAQYQRFEEILPLDVAKRTSRLTCATPNDTICDVACRDTESMYGEMGWWSLVGIFDAIMRNGGLPETPGDFIDLGAGSGKAVAGAGLLMQAIAHDSSLFRACEGAGASQAWAPRRLLGIEKCEAMHKASLDVAEEWQKHGYTPPLELHHGDAATADMRGVAVAIVHSTAFGDDLLEEIAQRAEEGVLPGGWVVTTTRPLPRTYLACGLDLVEARRRTVSWGPATVFLHRRRRTAEAAPQCTRQLQLGSGDAEMYMSQVWFHCRSCNLSGESGLCVPCATVCHADCDKVEFAAHSPFFCDCLGVQRGLVVEEGGQSNGCLCKLRC